MVKSKLVPFPKKWMKEMGIIVGKEGVLIDKQKLSDIKKFQQPKEEQPDTSPKKSNFRTDTGEKERAEKIGVY